MRVNTQVLALAAAVALALAACDKQQISQLATTVPQLMTVVPALVAADAPGMPAAQATGRIRFAGVSFSVETWRAESVAGQVEPAVVRSEAPGFGGAAPAHILFTFGGAPPGGAPPDILDPHTPQLRVYPVDGLRAIDPIVSSSIDELQAILAARPATFTADIPVFPIFNAAQVFRSQVKYLAFASGQGIRFVTAYAQDIAPIANADLFYTFQGLTGDGRYYVAFYYPASTQVLPESGAAEPAAADADAFVRNFDAYLAATVGRLDALRAQQFLPDLETFDRMMQSLNVAPPDRLPAPPAQRTPRVAGGAAVTFTADAALAVSPRGKIIAETPLGGAGLMAAPTHTLFAFDGAPWPSLASPLDAQLRVFPAGAYATLDPAVARAISDLKVLITTRPRITASLPILPRFSLPQLVQAQPKYIDFASGGGVRFLTVFAGASATATQPSVVYTFQGITHDGQYAVTLYHPVTSTALAAQIEPPAGITGTQAPAYQQYLAGLARLLNGLKTRAFTPDLALLDRLAQSLEISEPAAPAAAAYDPGAVSPEAAAAQDWVARSVGSVNVRAAPDLKARIVARLKLDELVYLVERNADASWVRVRLEYGVIGWVDARLLKSDVSFSGLPQAAP